jgi:chaperone modulatory protein CbpM
MTDPLLNEKAELSFDDLCQSCGLSAQIVVDYVQEGLFEVTGDDAKNWRFSEIHMVRIQKARRLEKDLRLNPAGSVLVMDLMEQIQDLQTRLRRFQGE